MDGAADVGGDVLGPVAAIALHRDLAKLLRLAPGPVAQLRGVQLELSLSFHQPTV